jgi:hypothetical protein
MLALLAVGVKAQQQAQFIVAMSDDKGTPVKSFETGDLTVFENGEQAKVLKVEPRLSELRVTLALDNGRPLGDIFVQVRNAAKEFISTLPPGTDIALMVTAPVPRYVVRATKNRDALLKGVDTIVPDGGSARSIEAFQTVGDNWKKQGGDGLVLVLFGSTFALEQFNTRAAEEAVNRLRDLRGVVHTVMLNPTNATDGEGQLSIAEQASRMTRGRFERIGSHLQLSVLTEIAKDVARTASGGNFLVTIERPKGATGKLGSLSLSTNSGLQAGRITRLQQ